MDRKQWAKIAPLVADHQAKYAELVAARKAVEVAQRNLKYAEARYDAAYYDLSCAMPKEDGSPDAK